MVAGRVGERAVAHPVRLVDRFLVDLDALAPVAVGVVDSFRIDVARRDDGFALRYSGQVELPAAGSWTFHLTSDDGSQLWIDGEHAVDNGGDHAPETRAAR